MTSPDPDTIVQRFIDGDLPEEEVQEALHLIADDAEARSLLQFELRMTQDLAASRSPSPSPEFARNTMERLAETDASTLSPRARVERWWRALTRPLVTVPVGPVQALATLTLVAAMTWLLWPSAPRAPRTATTSQSSAASAVQTASGTSKRTSETVLARFVYVADDANSVAVAGDFSQWEPIPLFSHTVNGKTVWTGLVPVPRGEHEYQFVIDGEKWVTDPLAPVKHDDGFGAKNAVLKL